MLERRAAIATLMANRPKDMFVVPGLGSTTYDMASLGEKDSDFYLWGAMGGAAMIGLGLALAKPNLKVAVVTGDGEMLMGLGSLATIGVQKPKNLTVVVIDNERYGETGMQVTHTASGVNLAAVAKACGFKTSRVVTKNISLRDTIHRTAGPHFLQIKVVAEKLPLVLPPQDGVQLKDRFRRALLGKG
jgi:thiamine pyrophosphate-dependent acetolactate synthase large subunit-like protein